MDRNAAAWWSLVFAKGAPVAPRGMALLVHIALMNVAARPPVSLYDVSRRPLFAPEGGTGPQEVTVLVDMHVVDDEPATTARIRLNCAHPLCGVPPRDGHRAFGYLPTADERHHLEHPVGVYRHEPVVVVRPRAHRRLGRHRYTAAATHVDAQNPRPTTDGVIYERTSQHEGTVPSKNSD